MVFEENKTHRKKKKKTINTSSSQSPPSVPRPTLGPVHPTHSRSRSRAAPWITVTDQGCAWSGRPDRSKPPPGTTRKTSVTDWRRFWGNGLGEVVHLGVQAHGTVGATWGNQTLIGPKHQSHRRNAKCTCRPFRKTDMHSVFQTPKLSKPLQKNILNPPGDSLSEKHQT